MPRLVAALLVTIIVCWVLFTYASRERFLVAANEYIPMSNVGPEPWNRHPTNSLPMDQHVKYPTMYMVEFDNGEYENRLKRIFSIPSAKQEELRRVNEWTILDPHNDTQASFIPITYETFLKHVETEINESPELFLPYDNPEHRPRLQIVHDVLLQFKKHVSNNFKYIVLAEVVLYREHKFHGKHVLFESVIQYDPKTKEWSIDVVNIQLLGIVSEDGIGMFPVIPYSSTQPVQADAMNASSQMLINDRDVIEVVRRQQKQQSDNINAEIAVSYT